jgi:CheY-like chemotaxis protein
MALVVAQHAAPDLILLDIQMPGSCTGVPLGWYTRNNPVLPFTNSGGSSAKAQLPRAR